MKIKRIIVAVLLLCITLSLSSCSKEVTIDGVTYKKTNGTCSVTFISTKDMDSIPKNIYVLDEVDGDPVESLGYIGYWVPSCRIYTQNVDRIYFPWSVKKDFGVQNINLPSSLKYYIFCSLPEIRYERYEYKFVLPNNIYIDAYQQDILPSRFGSYGGFINFSVSSKMSIKK